MQVRARESMHRAMVGGKDGAGKRIRVDAMMLT